MQSLVFYFRCCLSVLSTVYCCLLYFFSMLFSNCDARWDGTMLPKLTSSPSGGPQKTASLCFVCNVQDVESAEAPAILYNSLIFLFMSCLATSSHWLHGLNLVHSCNIKRQENVLEDINLVSCTVDSYFLFSVIFPETIFFICISTGKETFCLLSKYFALQLSRCAKMPFEALFND